MQPFDDMLPEERAPQYEELITLLQQAYHSPMPVVTTKQAQILSRVQARLMETDPGTSLTVCSMRSLLSSLLASSLQVLSCSLPIAPQRLALLRALYLPLSHFNPYPAVVFSFHSKIQNSIVRTTPSHGSIYLRTSLVIRSR